MVSANVCEMFPVLNDNVTVLLVFLLTLASHAYRVVHSCLHRDYTKSTTETGPVSKLKGEAHLLTSSIMSLQEIESEKS